MIHHDSARLTECGADIVGFCACSARLSQPKDLSLTCEGRMSDHVMPFYVVCDESYSMTDHIDALNEGLRDLHLAVGTDPAIADSTRFCLIAFSSSAEVLLPLSRFSDVTEMAGLVVRGSTEFGPVFTLLRDTIQRDMVALRAAGRRVYRPAVFFLSDGQPTDPATWQSAHDRLTDPAWAARPNIISFGIGDADRAIIDRIGTFRAFMSHQGTSPASALREFARALTRSVIRSAVVQDGDVGMSVVPSQVSGFTALRDPGW
jgi:uncharacterized protein YegL